MGYKLRSDEQEIRGQVYNKTTGRWLGPIANFEDKTGAPAFLAPTAGLPVGVTLTKVQLRQIAQDFAVADYKALNKAELTDLLVARGLVAAEQPEEVPPGYEEAEGGEADPA